LCQHTLAGKINGTIEAIGEMVFVGLGSRLFNSTVKNIGKPTINLIGKGLEKAGIKESDKIIKEIAKYQSDTLRQALNIAVKNVRGIVGGVASEVGEEVAQEITSGVLGVHTQKKDNAEFSDYLQAIRNSRRVIMPTITATLLPAMAGVNLTNYNFNRNKRSILENVEILKDLHGVKETDRVKYEAIKDKMLEAEKIAFRDINKEYVYINPKTFEKIAEKQGLSPESLAENLEVEAYYQKSKDNEKKYGENSILSKMQIPTEVFDVNTREFDYENTSTIYNDLADSLTYSPNELSQDELNIVLENIEKGIDEETERIKANLEKTSKQEKEKEQLGKELDNIFENSVSKTNITKSGKNLLKEILYTAAKRKGVSVEEIIKTLPTIIDERKILGKKGDFDLRRNLIKEIKENVASKIFLAEKEWMSEEWAEVKKKNPTLFTNDREKGVGWDVILEIFKDSASYFRNITESNLQEILKGNKRSLMGNSELNEQIDIVNRLLENNETYYQAMNTDLELKQKIEAIDLTKEFKEKNITLEDLKNKLNGFIGQKIEFNTLSEPLKITLNDKSKMHLININNRKGKNTAINNINDIINNAVYIEKAPVDLSHNTKKETLERKKLLDSYLYFYTPIKIKEKDFLVKLNTEKYKKDLNNDLSYLYDINLIELSVSASRPTYKKVGGGHTFQKSPNQTYTLTIQDILTNVKTFDGKNALEEYIKEQESIKNSNILYQRNNDNDKKIENKIKERTKRLNELESLASWLQEAKPVVELTGKEFIQGEKNY
jgi:hypothetical protein